MRPIDIAVLVSGSGSNLQALIDHRGAYEIVVVVSDRRHVKALDRAEAAGLSTRLVEWEGDRATFTTAVCDVVDQAGAELMVLAGFMRILGPEAIARFPGRILNIHPSLLPAFPGARAVGQALEAGVAATGVTVHVVDEHVDHGPIVAQVEVPVLDGDDEASLHARIQVQEHLLYPRVVDRFARGEIGVVT
ncbi:MAG TPA: phosphoribosylglycinamide formyltransferase [Acidimicrobiia bacterium]|nr:phosphoribosylglycinamide formyltransferase [Acidimicrobiia bacterium]